MFIDRDTVIKKCFKIIKTNLSEVVLLYEWIMINVIYYIKVLLEKEFNKLPKGINRTNNLHALISITLIKIDTEDHA